MTYWYYSYSRIDEGRLTIGHGRMETSYDCFDIIKFHEENDIENTTLINAIQITEEQYYKLLHLECKKYE